MKSLNVLLSLVVLFVAILVSLKANSSGLESFHVTFVGCHPSGDCFIGINPKATQTECPSTGQIRLGITRPGADAVYAAAMTAFVAGKEIRAHLLDDCKDGFPTPNWLHVNNGDRVN